MERIKALNRYQKGSIIFVIISVLVFSIIYPVTIAKEGFAYEDAILIPVEKNGNTVYSGEIQGTPVSFSVSADKAVTFQYGEKTYGPYTAREDSTAIPKDNEFSENMKGVELRCGEKIVFRGGVMNIDEAGLHLLYNEDGSAQDIGVSVKTSYGIILDENGNEVDMTEPSASVILDLMNTPSLSHKGDWQFWFYGVVLCVISIMSVLFADELFRLSLIFKVNDVESIEPSDWEIAGRYIGWTVMAIMSVVFFVIGLQ